MAIFSDIGGKGYNLFEQERLATFRYWKFSDDLPCNKFALSAAGFYKCNTEKDGSDECVCFYCGKALGDWDAEDDPFKEHKAHSSKCKFINLGRRESELKVKEFLDLVESWCLNQMNKSMGIEAEERSRAFNTLQGIIEAKFRK
ncbi:baculoviral IAP repeat-containing protein 5.2-B [Bradysia coprophila]|uniref:baculoviral IAP repeat-containing protein 5.2-B n=1 Tax=Bradysia coprophila TaxID=38358 RepID=UPI00187D9483|nr:baculoviral IAP repeat-containing protein 5.2-B [Bradysia coprophila]